MSLNLGINGIRNLCLPLAILALTPDEVKAELTIKVEAPGVQETSILRVRTETFDDFPKEITSEPSVTAVGILSPGAAIVAANQFGGAEGVRQYAAIGSQSGTTSMTLTFYEPQTYFGFWWSAADSRNSVKFYCDTTLVGTIHPDTSLEDANTPDYFGDPASSFRGQDSSEKFVYVNAFFTEGTVITSVVFENEGTESGFEVDNFSIWSPLPITVHERVLPSGTVPEPSSIILTGTGIVFGAATCWRSRCRRVGRSAARPTD